MAWIEQTGQHTWRVRYPHGDGRSHYGSASGFSSAKAARDYAHDLESDRRRGRWIDPASTKTTVSTWSSVWVETLDVETRTEKNYRFYLRNHILPAGATPPSATSPPSTPPYDSKTYANATPPPPWQPSSPCSP